MQPGYGPTHGTLDLHADGSFEYVADLGYTGPDSFRYVVTNNAFLSEFATVALNVLAAAPAAKEHLPVNDIDEAQKIANQGVPIEDACEEEAGPDVTKWYARDLITQAKHSIDLTFPDPVNRWDIVTFKQQAANKMSYKWLDFGSPEKGRGVNTVVLGGKEDGLVFRKQQLGNIGFMVIPTIFRLPPRQVDVAKEIFSFTTDDVYRQDVLDWKGVDTRHTIQQVARIGYAVEPYHRLEPFGRLPIDRVVYRADNLAAFAAGREIAVSFMQMLGTNDPMKTVSELHKKLAVDDATQLSENKEALAVIMEKALRKLFGKNGADLEEAVKKMGDFQPLKDLPEIQLRALSSTSDYHGFNFNSLSKKNVKDFQSSKTAIGMETALFKEFKKMFPFLEGDHVQYETWRKTHLQNWTDQADGFKFSDVKYPPAPAPAAQVMLPVNDIDKAQKIANQGVDIVNSTDSAGSNVTKWFARDLIEQVQHSMNQGRAWDIKAFEDQATNKMSYKWLDFGSPKAGKGVNTVVVGDLIFRKEHLWNFAFQAIPMLVPLGGDELERVSSLPILWSKLWKEDIFKAIALKWEHPDTKGEIDQFAKIGYAVESTYATEQFGQLPNNRIVYRADTLVAFAAGRKIASSFLKLLDKDSDEEAVKVLRNKLSEPNVDQRNANFLDLTMKMETTLQNVFGNNGTALENVANTLAKFQPIEEDERPEIKLRALSFTPDYHGFNLNSLSKEKSENFQSRHTAIGMEDALRKEFKKLFPKRSHAQYRNWRKTHFQNWTEQSNGFEFLPD